MTFDNIDATFSANGLNQNAFTSIDLALDQDNDLIILPNGYLGVVTGSLKLQQDVRLFLLTSQGNCLTDSRWGNAALSLLGQAPVSPTVLQAAVTGSLALLKHYKDQEEVSRGYPLENSELIQSIQGVSITSSDGLTWDIDITIFDKNMTGNVYQISLNGG